MNGVGLFAFALGGVLVLLDFLGRIRQSSSFLADFPSGVFHSAFSGSKSEVYSVVADEDTYAENYTEDVEKLSQLEHEDSSSFSDYSIETYQQGIPANLNISNCKPRICYNSNNIILYTYRNYAGFGDRQSVLFSLSNIAASLCAKLVFPLPCRVLNHVKTSCEMTWHDMLNITYLHGPLQNTPILLITPVPKNAMFDVELKGGSYTEYSRALAAVEAGQTFRWTIKANFYRIRRRITGGMFPNGEKDAIGSAKPYIYWKYPFGCIYIKMEYPRKLFQIASSFLHDLKLKKKGYISLHLRRGDQKTVCRTDLSRMKYYFDCWTNGNDLSNKTMLLFTDETSSDYLNGLQEKAKGYGINLRIDAEKRLDQYFREGFKIGIYQTSEIIQSQSALRYELRRSKQCNSKACNAIE